MSQPSVVIGTPICQSKSYILTEFLHNQREIKERYSNSRIVFAVLDSVSERKFVELADLCHYGEVIYYQNANTFWLTNIAAAREAIRQYVLSLNDVEYLLVCDCDMTYDPDIVQLMLEQMEGYDAVSSAYCVRQTSSWGFGSSPAMYRREILEKVHWRCKCWSEKRFLAEDELLDYDLFLHGARINKGAYVTNTHYQDSHTGHELKAPFKITFFRRVTNSLQFRFVIIGLSQLVHMSLAWPLYIVCHLWLKI